MIITHNGPVFDALVLRKAGLLDLSSVNRMGDTIYECHALRPERPKRLEYQGALLTAYGYWKDEGKSGEEGEAVPDHQLDKYCGRDTQAQGMIHRYYAKQLQQHPEEQRIYAHFMELARLAHRMSWEGIAVDHSKRLEWAGILESRKQENGKKIERIGDKLGVKLFFKKNKNDDHVTFSKKALRMLLFGKFKLPVLERTETGLAKIDKAALRTLREITANTDCIKLIDYCMGYSAAEKLNSNYAEGLPFLSDGRIHPIWKAALAETMRWKCARPNGQNIPPKMRDIFVPDEGCCFVEADGRQIEFRMVGIITGCKAILEACKQDDPYHPIILKLFGLTNEEHAALDEEQRERIRVLGKKNIHGCVPMNTQILTRHGWRCFRQVEVDDLVLGLNPATGKKEWTPIREKHFYKNAPLVNMFLKHRGFNVFCTPDHRWIIDQRKEGRQGLRHLTREMRATENLSEESNVVTNAHMTPDLISMASDPLTLRKYRANWQDQVCAMSSAERRAFLAGFLIADGHQPSNKPDSPWMWCQLKGELDDAVATAAFIEHHGYIWRSNKNWYEADMIWDHTNKSMSVGCLSKKAHVTGQSLHREDIGRGDVFCITTDFGSWTMKQGATITLTGNSDYGGGAKTIWQQMVQATDDKGKLVAPDLKLKDVEAMLSAWKAITPEIWRHVAGQQAALKRLGYVPSEVLGHKRHYPGGAKYTEIANAPYQTTTAELVNLNSIELDKQLQMDKLGAIRAQTHDGILVNAPRIKADRVAKVMQTHMEAPIQIQGRQVSLPFKVEVKSRWYEPKQKTGDRT